MLTKSKCAKIYIFRYLMTRVSLKMTIKSNLFQEVTELASVLICIFGEFRGKIDKAIRKLSLSQCDSYGGVLPRTFEASYPT